VDESQRRRALEVEDIRRNMQAVYREQYEKSMVEEKLKLKKLQTLKLTKDFTAEIRNWFMESYG
jgi:hypothetical protein